MGTEPSLLGLKGSHETFLTDEPWPRKTPTQVWVVESQRRTVLSPLAVACTGEPHQPVRSVTERATKSYQHGIVLTPRDIPDCVVVSRERPSSRTCQRVVR